MLGEKSAIRKYRAKLPEELSRRYGGKGPYTEAQVSKTVSDLRLSDRYIQYAYLMYCHDEVLEQYGLAGEKLQDMLGVIASVGGGGIVAGAIEPIFGGGDGGDGFGGFDGGGGGE